MNRLLVGADVLLVALGIWKYSRIPAEIPLFYSRAWGEDQIVDYWYILLLPFFMHIFYYANIFFYEKYLSKNTLSPMILTVVNSLVIVSFTLITIKILLLVT